MIKLNETVENFFINFTKPSNQDQHCRMDAKVKKSCPNCSQHFSMKSPHQPKGRVPLLQKCGHSCCEVCLHSMIRFAEPIVCKVCQSESEVQPGMSPNDLYNWFPVNIYMLGELALQLMDNQDQKYLQEEDFYINLKEIINSAEISKGKCVECKAPTTKQCRECVTVLCESCFHKIHKFHIFKSHILTNIDTLMEPCFCTVHPEKQLDYYCKDCAKTVCMDCMIVGGERSCKNHEIIPMQEVNEIVLEDLNDMAPKIDETYRRLTKTAVDIGNLLKNIESGNGNSELDKLKQEVYQHFYKLLAAIQTHMQETMDTMTKLKDVEKTSLTDAKHNVENSIKKALVVLKKINAAMTSPQRNKANLSAILDEAKEVMNAPWYLMREDQKEDSLKIEVQSELVAAAGGFVRLRGAGGAGAGAGGWSLRAADRVLTALPPVPPAPVFPPQLPRDVRETTGFKKAEVMKPKVEAQKLMEPTSFLSSAPKYRTKSGSNSSLNSIGSDQSHGRPGSVFSTHSRGESFTPVVHVPPYAESFHPKPLIEGCQELIYISHIISPENFYVQRACHQNFVKEMLREFRNASNLPKPQLNNLAEGKVYLAFNAADGEWQRARVLRVQREGRKPVCQVFCIDFGSTELVPIDKLRLLPAARLQTPPLAVGVALANCAPKYGSWAADDAVLVQKIIDNKKALLHVRRVLTGPGGEPRLLGDVTTVEDGVSLLHALAFHDRARLRDPQLPYPRAMSLSDRPKLIFNTSDFKLKSPEEVVITHVVSPDNFHVRRCHFQETFHNLCDELNDYYSLAVTSGSIHCPEVGMFCVAHVESSEDGERAGGWRRGVVLEAPGRLRVRLWLPDTGERVLLHHAQLRRIRPEFAKLKALATECHLSGITPYNKRWSSGSVALLRQHASRPLTLVLEEARGRPPPARAGAALAPPALGVALYDGDECINTLMVRHKFAVSIGLFTFNKNQPIEDQTYTIKTPQEKKMAQPIPKKKITILNKNTPPPKVNEQDLEAKDKGPLKLEVKVLSCQSPSLLYVSLIDQQKTFKELFEALQESYVNKKSNGKKEWTVGEKCCTIYKESKTWRRAVIVTLNDENATVFFTDFAVVDTVPLTELRELEPQFARLGDGAIKCHLSGIEPALGGEWPSLTKEYLRELLEAYQRIFITKNGSIKDNSLPVEVWVYHVTQGEALEPDRAEWRCLNRKVIEQGLAVPTKDLELTTDKEKKHENDDVISIFNITGSVREWLQLERPAAPAALAPAAAASSPLATPAGQSEDEEEAGREDHVNTKFVSDWLPPEPLESREFVAMPTYVDGAGHIFLHDVRQQGTLDLLRNALDVRFRAPAARARAAWAPGQPCIAKFYLDDKFYRGRVLEVENDSAIVHYIDYGNEEKCSFKDLRKNIVLHEIPTQAHKCELARIRPAGGAWDKTTLDYIHKSIVEKQCLVRVTGAAPGGELAVELKFDRLWLNDHLVEFELARYTDGTKAVVPKYVPAPAELDRSLDSGPDYIVEDAASSSSSAARGGADSGPPAPPGDWSALMAAAEGDDSFTTFPDNNTGQQFLCRVLCIGAQDLVFELSVVHNDETNLIYDELFAELQARGDDALPVAGVYDHKACIAKYHEDGRWYRAAILEYDEANKMIKVKYVDYGNYEIIPVSEAREIRDEWAALPPRAVPARLQGLAPAPDASLQLLSQEFEETFLSKGPFHAKVVESGPVLTIELTNEDGSLPYAHLIENGVLVTST